MDKRTWTGLSTVSTTTTTEPPKTMKEPDFAPLDPPQSLSRTDNIPYESVIVPNYVPRLTKFG